jgi:glycosyltransferase involved in cell wall biosynthesis
VRELALALGSGHPELEVRFVINPDLPVTSAIEELGRRGRVAPSDDPGLPTDAIYHVPSPLEPVQIDRLWPPKLRSSALVVTMHDLIPALWPEENMPDPAVQRFYWARLELARQAERVLSVSQATARDAERLLGLRRDRISVTGGGVSDDFAPPESRTAARTELGRLRPAIDGDFVLYTGGMDYRKNVGGLLAAYAGLAPDLREAYKLVIVGRLGLQNAHGTFAEEAERLGLADRVVFTGHVSEEELILLYQATTLFVFPSLYEGFGLPVVEALACGAPALAGRNSSLVELIAQDEALFDPADPASIRAALERALTDDALLGRLRRPEVREQFSWRKIAGRTAAAYEEVGGRRRPRRIDKREGYHPANGA